MSIHKRMCNWCPKPEKPISTLLTRLASLLCVSILIGGLLLTVFAAFLLPAFSGNDYEERLVPKELERISFPGGAIVVRKIPYPLEKGDILYSIEISIEAHIASEEGLSAYVNSRTNALNALLNSVDPAFIIEVFIIFRTPMKPEEFMDLYETSLVKLSNYAVIVTDETTGTKVIEIFCHYTLGTKFTEDLAHIKEGYSVEGVIGANGLLEAKVARILQSDSRVLLIDPAGDPIAQKIAEKYHSMGFYVSAPASASIDMLGQYVKLKHGVAWVSPYPPASSKRYEEYASTTPLTVDELLDNSLKYDGQVVHVFGKVSALKLLESPLFRLDEKLLVCYIYDDINLYSQIGEAQNGDPMIVTGKFYHDGGILYAESIRPSKKIKQ